MKKTRRDFIKFIGGGLCLAGTGVLLAEDNPAKKPNIILCMADDQGWGDMAYTGHPVIKTPNFDAMASVSLRFDRFYAAAPVCSPTRGSVMTGRHPNRFGCFSWGNTLRPQEITIAEALKSTGYVTGHFGKWHLGPVRKGSPVNPGASGFDEWFSSPNYFDNNPILSREGVAVQTEGESSMVTVDAALDFINKHCKSSRPFFAVVWFGSPHNPHKAAPEFRKLYADEKNKDLYGEITGMDKAFGKLRSHLRELNIQQNTILWYCSDNGGLVNSSTGGRGKKGSIYEGGLRVPAMLEWPEKISSPMTADIPCNTSDIYPTILEITGIRMKNQTPIDGISLVDLINGKMNKRPAPIGFWQYTASGIKTPSEGFMKELLNAQKQGKEPDNKEKLCLDAGEIKKQYSENEFPGHAAWLDWPWKLHRIEKKGELTWELYNLLDDPYEKNNTLEQETDRVKLMKTQLAQWQKSVVNSLNGKDY